jgi:hypothetical protein
MAMVEKLKFINTWRRSIRWSDAEVLSKSLEA